MFDTPPCGIHDASFRDPSGFVFHKNGELYRQVNQIYKIHYDYFIESGLYQDLLEHNLIIPHEEDNPLNTKNKLVYKVLKPIRVNFISYPYEWCFSQLKDAALTTLRIQKLALEKEMSLKDASAYNIQFYLNHPILIDTLSFERYQSGKPWVAYHQYCRHFLAPLALMSKIDVRLGRLVQLDTDGVPLDLASKLLPRHTFLKFSLFLHIHMHARSRSRFAGTRMPKRAIRGKMSKHSLLGLINSLERATLNLVWKPRQTEWGDYYQHTNYSNEALNHKKELVDNFISKTDAMTIWDFGANTGFFSRIPANLKKECGIL